MNHDRDKRDDNTIIDNALIAGEGQAIEFKGPFSWEKDEDTKRKLVKHILGMANTRDGGTILIGIGEQGPGRSPEVVGLTCEQAETFDMTKVSELVNTYCDPRIRLELTKIEYNNKLIVQIRVHPFDDCPVLCCKNLQLTNGARVVSEGDFLIRTLEGKTERISDSAILRDLLEAAMLRAARARAVFCAQMQTSTREERFIRPGEQVDDKATMPKEWGEIESEIKQKYSHASYWIYSIRPSLEKQVELRVLKEAVEQTAVHMRGWVLPFVQGNSELQVIDNVLVSQLDDDKYVERVVVEQSGAFWFLRISPEDQRSWRHRVHGLNDDSKVVCLEVLVDLILEALIFAGRYGERLSGGRKVRVSLTLRNAKDRVLMSLDSWRSDILRAKSYVCQSEEVLWEGFKALSELLPPQSEDLFIAVARHFLERFQWLDTPVELLRSHYQSRIQDRLWGVR